MNRAAERRKEDRHLKPALLYPVSFRVRIGNTVILSETVNYHHLGACLRMPETSHPLFQTPEASNARIDFYLGNRCVKADLAFRIAWESLRQDGLVGVEFIQPLHERVERKPRFNAHPLIAPTLASQDPLDPNRILYFKVLNFSSKGMLLSTSLSNKHLFAGMELRQARLNLPDEKTLCLDLTLRNTRRSTDDRTFQIGVSVEGAPEGYTRLIGRYLSSLGNHPSDHLEALSSEGMLGGSLKHSLTFRIIRTEEEYEQVLKLRFAAYASHGKVKKGSSWASQGEGLRNEGTIIGGWLGGQLVSTFEMRYGTDALGLRNQALIARSLKRKVDWTTLAEVNRLAIDPQVHGTDLVVGMIQKAHAMLIAGGGFHCVILATDRLLSIYRRVGFKKLGASAPHPVDPSQTLFPMYLDRETYLNARHIHPHYWRLLFGETQKLMEEIGILTEVRLNWWQALRAFFMKCLIAALKAGKRHRRTIRNNP